MLWATSVFIDYLRNRTSSLAYLEQVRNGLVEGYCSVNTEAELWAGHRTDEERLRATAVLFYFSIVPLDSATARLAGSLLNRKSPGEKKAHFRDSLIAATAIQQGEAVLTADAASQRVFGDAVDYLIYP